MPRKKSTPPAPLRLRDASIANLETDGEHLKIYSLQTLLTNKRNPETRAVARLGDVLLPWFEKAVARPALKLGNLVELWEQCVPPVIVRRSRLVGLHRGTLTVAMDSATVRAELDTALRGGLLRRLQTESRGALYRIKTVVQGSPEL